MLDLFTIFSKSGIVLWCMHRTPEVFTSSVNALIRNVLLEERVGTNIYPQNNVTLKFKLDNEFELVFVVAYQNFVQQAYVDKFLDDVSREFRDKYRQELEGANWFFNYNSFEPLYEKILADAQDFIREQEAKPKIMRSFQESQKSKKTIASLTENKQEPVKTNTNKKKKPATKSNKNGGKEEMGAGEAPVSPKVSAIINANNNINLANSLTEEDAVIQNRLKFEKKMKNKKDKTSNKSPASTKEKSKKPRIWDNAGSNKDLKELDFSKSTGENQTEEICRTINQYNVGGNMEGEVPSMDYSSSSEESEEDEDEEETKPGKSNSNKGSMFSMFKSLVGSKTITEKDMAPILSKLKDHMIAKNVAADIADKLCQSIAAKLNGKNVGTFSGVASLVKSTLTDSLVQLLSPKRRMDILRDVLEAKSQGRPYTIVFCGVNGVGKSTNLAKIAYWLTSNKLRVLIAACDTFRAGAVEQLRSHRNNLNNHHQGRSMVELFEKGYGKDPAGIAMEAINSAREGKFDVVLIDTAGRMQDNEPLMRALAKLIKVNNPDLVVFVGEALVGNEAVDQLTKFNQALADFSSQENPHLIDGIVLTKFDTIDDKVGAAISMTYITGQPIIFMGTGQTYTDLKKLDPRAVVRALMK